MNRGPKKQEYLIAWEGGQVPSGKLPIDLCVCPHSTMHHIASHCIWSENSAESLAIKSGSGLRTLQNIQFSNSGSGLKILHIIQVSNSENLQGILVSKSCRNRKSWIYTRAVRPSQEESEVHMLSLFQLWLRLCFHVWLWLLFRLWLCFHRVSV